MSPSHRTCPLSIRTGHQYVGPSPEDTRGVPHEGPGGATGDPTQRNSNRPRVWETGRVESSKSDPLGRKGVVCRLLATDPNHPPFLHWSSKRKTLPFSGGTFVCRLFCVSGPDRPGWEPARRRRTLHIYVHHSSAVCPGRGRRGTRPSHCGGRRPGTKSTRPTTPRTRALLTACRGRTRQESGPNCRYDRTLAKSADHPSDERGGRTQNPSPYTDDGETPVFIHSPGPTVSPGRGQPESLYLPGTTDLRRHSHTSRESEGTPSGTDENRE